MKALDVLNVLADISASQKGLFTAAQASGVNVGRMELSRLAKNGHVKRVVRGVYRVAAAPSLREEDVWAAWLSLEPSVLAYSRDRFSSVVSHNTAAWLMELGELEPTPLTFTCQERRQVASRGLRAIRGTLGYGDVVTVLGMPCTTAQRTIVDLIKAGEDISLVANVVKDALDKKLIDDETVLRHKVDVLGDMRGVLRGQSLWNAMMGE